MARVETYPSLGRVVKSGDILYVVDVDDNSSKSLIVEELLGGWKDLSANLVASASGGGAPALAEFGPSANIKQMSFSIGDSVYLGAHINRDMKPLEACFPHVHWSTDGTDTNIVKWEINYMSAKGHNQESFSTESTITVEEAAQGTAWRHMTTQHATGFAIPEVDSIVLMELKRVTNGGTENTDTVFGLFVNFHYLA